MTRNGITSFLGVLVLAAGSAAADETPLTLAQALDMAAERNPGISAARERSAAQQLRAAAAGRLLWPRLTLSSGWSWTDTPAAVFARKLNAGEFTADDFAIDRLNDPAGLSHLGSVMVLEAPVDLFGRVGALRDQQLALSGASSAAATEATQDVRLRVVEAYWRTAVARRAVAVTEQALAGARARERDVEARATAGSALTADLLRARARRREREADLATQRGDARIAAATLGRLLGAAEGTTFVPSESAPAPEPLVGSEAEWVARAQAARPALEAVRHRLDGARLGARAEHRTWYPEVGVMAQVQDDRLGWSRGGVSAAVGAQIRWTPFDASRGKRIAAAEAESRAAEQDLRGAADEIRLDVETAYRRAEAAREAHAAAAGGAAEGREALRVIQERREAGIATLTDELETEAASLAAELREIQAAAEAAIADAALARAAGVL
jgi:outer membrane protein